MHKVDTISTRLPTFARALRSRRFFLVWAGQSISGLGDSVFVIALLWTVLSLTKSATFIGWVMVAQVMPKILFLLLGGVVADKMPRRTVMLCSDLLRGGLVGILALSLLMVAHPFDLLLVLIICFSIVDAFFNPAYRATFPQLVQSEDLTSANTLTMISLQINGLLGPIIGAFLITLFSPASVFLFDGVTFLVSAACLWAVPASLFADAPMEGFEELPQGLKQRLSSLVEDVREGLVYVASSAWLWIFTLIAAMINLCLVGTLFVALPKLVSDVYLSGVWLLGVIGSSNAVGALIGSSILQKLLLKFTRRGIVALVAVALSGVGLGLFGLPVKPIWAPYLGISASLLLGFGLAIFSIIWITLQQEKVSNDKLGRVSSITELGSLLLTPIAYLTIGLLADHSGPATVFLGSGLLILCSALFALTVPKIRLLK